MNDAYMGGELKRKGPPTRFLLGRARRIDVTLTPAADGRRV